MNDTKNSPQPSSSSPSRRIQRSGMGFSIALVGLMLLLIAGAAFGAMQLLKSSRPAASIAPLSAQVKEKNAQLAQRRANEAAQLESYGWLDKANGIARIPIEQAMAVIAAQGLPVGIPPTEAATPTPESATAPIDLSNLTYNKDIQPIFLQHCSECHGEDNPDEGLTLSTYKGLMNGSLNGGVLKKGDPDASYLVEMIVTGKMPKRGDPLSQSEIDMIIAWIAAGAPEGDASSAPVATVTSTVTSTAASISETVSITATAAATDSVDLANVSFANDVLPIFTNHCSECHGDDNPEEGLELTSYKKLMNGSLNGGVISKGNPDKSYLVEMIVSGKMPKRRDPLTQREIDTIIAWIEQGAVDDSETAVAVTPTATSTSAVSTTVSVTATTAATLTLTATVTQTPVANVATPTATATATKAVATKAVATKTPTIEVTAIASPTVTRTATISADATITTSATLTQSGEITSSASVSETAATDSVDLANVSFANDVLPIFMTHCSECHGDDNPEEGLELTSYKKLMNGSLNGGVISKGSPDKSYLVEMIVSGKMPKRRDPLTQREIDTIIAWIEQGAVDDSEQ